MKLIIDIDENLYTRLFVNGVDNYDDAIDMAKSIRKGIPLEKNKTDILKEMGKLKGNSGCDYFTNNTVDNCMGIVRCYL